jgi:hypothetical protein
MIHKATINISERVNTDDEDGKMCHNMMHLETSHQTSDPPIQEDN